MDLTPWERWGFGGKEVDGGLWVASLASPSSPVTDFVPGKDFLVALMLLINVKIC